MSCGRPGCGCGHLYYAEYCRKCRVLARVVRALDFHGHVTLVPVKTESEWVDKWGNSAGPVFVTTSDRQRMLVGLPRVALRVMRELVSVFHRRVKA